MLYGFTERAVIFSAYVINTLVLATQTDCANSAIKTELLDAIRSNFRLKKKEEFVDALYGYSGVKLAIINS
jgi:hypothetical protein